MTTLIAILILLAVTGGAALYLKRAKKRNAACVGCPYARQCGGKCGASKS